MAASISSGAIARSNSANAATFSDRFVVAATRSEAATRSPYCIYVPTQWRERTGLARQRSALAFVFIAALLMTHAHAWLGVAAALLVAAGGLWARSPFALALTTVLAAACAALIVVA